MGALEGGAADPGPADPGPMGRKNKCGSTKFFYTFLQEQPKDISFKLVKGFNQFLITGYSDDITISIYGKNEIKYQIKNFFCYTYQSRQE